MPSVHPDWGVLPLWARFWSPGTQGFIEFSVPTTSVPSLQQVIASLIKGYPRGVPTRSGDLGSHGLRRWNSQVGGIMGIGTIVLSAALIMGALGLVVKATGMGDASEEIR